MNIHGTRTAVPTSLDRDEEETRNSRSVESESRVRDRQRIFIVDSRDSEVEEESLLHDEEIHYCVSMITDRHLFTNVILHGSLCLFFWP